MVSKKTEENNPYYVASVAAQKEMAVMRARATFDEAGARVREAKVTW